MKKSAFGQRGIPSATIFVFVFNCFLWSLPLFAKTLGTLAVEGVSSKMAVDLKDQLKKYIPNDFGLEDVDRALAAAYHLGNFDGIEVFYEDKGEITNVVFKFFPVKIIR